MDRIKYSTGAKWESIVGYSRAIRAGDLIEVSGTCAINENGDPSGGDSYQQTKKIIEIITKAIENLGGKIEDVIRTRIYVKDIDQWQEVGRAHGETFHAIRPVTTMVEVSRLVSTEFLVEIEATALVKD